MFTKDLYVRLFYFYFFPKEILILLNRTIMQSEHNVLTDNSTAKLSNALLYDILL